MARDTRHATAGPGWSPRTMLDSGRRGGALLADTRSRTSIHMRRGLCGDHARSATACPAHRPSRNGCAEEASLCRADSRFCRWRVASRPARSAPMALMNRNHFCQGVIGAAVLAGGLPHGSRDCWRAGDGRCHEMRHLEGEEVLVNCGAQRHSA